MIYGLSLLFMLLGLVLLIPASRKLLQIREINRNSALTTGKVLSANNAFGWLWTAEIGSSTRPLIQYQSPKGIDLTCEVHDSSMFTFHKYEPGQAVEVIFDAGRPGRAYLKPEMQFALKDFWMGLAALLFAAALWGTGVVFGLPF